MRKSTMRMAGLLAVEMLFATEMASAAAPVDATDHIAAPGATAAATQQAPAETETSAEAGVSKQALPQEKEQAAPQGEEHTIDIQLDYLEGRFFKKRSIDLYNLHVFWQNRTVHHIKTYYGLTVERAVGSTTKDKIHRQHRRHRLAASLQSRPSRRRTRLRLPLAHRATPHISLYVSRCRQSRLHVPPLLERHEGS